MAKASDPNEGEIWGTWEELLLACAVNRHGTRRWDSVSMEIQSRTPVSHLVTPQDCRQRFSDLQRRFGGGAGDEDGGDADNDPPSEVPWVEELRKLRVAELRREVERYDLSIGSLQLKVKRLEEERERSLREEKSGEGKPDQDAKEEGVSPGSTPESVAGDRISSGGVSSPSCEQSNSPDPKQQLGQDVREPVEAAVAGVEAEAADLLAGQEEKTAEGSYNGSTGSPGADAGAQPQAMGESGESIAESKGGGDGEEAEESSDVQSSASLSRRRRRRKEAVPGGTGEEPVAEDLMTANKRGAEESQPLVSILEIIRSDKYGSVFERRLESQESVSYRSLVRQHVDLEMVRAKLDRMESDRSCAAPEFFRDLLLLCTNAVVFYTRGSPESTAAVNLRRLVAKEMTAALRRPKELPAPPPSPPPPQPEPSDPKPKPEPDLAGSLLDKPVSSAPLIVCRKRSSMSNKPAAAAEKEERDEKSDLARKESDSEEKSLPKKTTKERSVLSGTTRGLRTNKVRGGKAGGGPAARRTNLTPAPILKSKPADKVAAVETAVKPDKKNGGGGAAATALAASSAKKKSANSFLNRMKRNSNGTLMEMLKGSSSSGGGSGGSGAEKKKQAKGDCRRDKSSRQEAGGGAGKKAADTGGGSAKRSVGRPPKRAAAAAPPTPPPTKKARVEADAAAPSRTPAATRRKRGRR